MNVPRAAPWLAALVVIGVALRWSLLSDYGALGWPDTVTYVDAARDLADGSFSRNLGRRTPGYPALVLLAGESEELIVAMQMLFGIATMLLLFAIARQLGAPRGLAFGAALAHSVSLQQLFQEPNLATETASAFSVAATLALLLKVLEAARADPATGRRRRHALAAATGITGAAAIMIRPQFVYFAALLPVLVLMADGWRWPCRAVMATAATVALPMVMAVLGWCAVVQAKTGHFTMSTQSGFTLVNHTIEYIERAPPEFAVARDVLLRVREARKAEVGHGRNTIWYALPELLATTGWSLPEASKQMQRMSTRMFLENPVTQARSVASAWIDFWTVPIFWSVERIDPPQLASALQGVWWFEHKLLRAGNALFLLTLIAVALHRGVRRRLCWDLRWTVLATLVIGSSVLQALADQGASSRYALPTQSLVVLSLALWGWQAWRSREPT